MTNKLSSSSNPNSTIDTGKIALYGTSTILILLGIVIAVEKISEYNRKKKIDLTKERIFLIGDSLAVGLISPMSKTASNNKTQFGSKTVGGTSINQWSKKNLQDIINFKPTIVMISLGTNDANGIDRFGDSVEDTIDTDIQTLLNRLSVTNANIIWLLPPNIKVFKSMPSVRYHIIKSGVKVINSQLFDIQLSSDGIHPTGTGYSNWNDNIWQSLSE